ncbi:MAG: c-type cytochrome [Flavobacteriales bacterium]
MIRFFFYFYIALFLFIACHEKKSSHHNQPYNNTTSKASPKDKKFIKGETIFNNQCASCHRMDRKLVGPSLKNVTKRHPKKWLFSFISDNQTLIQNKDSSALSIWLEYNKSPMPNFKHLTKKELENLYYYLNLYQ